MELQSNREGISVIYMNNELKELENITLEIRWSDAWSKRKGRMCIYLYNFITTHSITKFRKLLKIIRTSDTPDEEQKIVDLFNRFNEQYEPCRQQLKMEKFQADMQMGRCQTDVDVLKVQRDRYRRNTPPYKKYAALLKKAKGELIEAKAAYRQAVRNEKKIEKTMVFIKKCLETMKQGGA